MSRGRFGSRGKKEKCPFGNAEKDPALGNEDFVGQEGWQGQENESLDRLAFGRRNSETDSENRRKWLDFPCPARRDDGDSAGKDK